MAELLDFKTNNPCMHFLYTLSLFTVHLHKGGRDFVLVCVSVEQPAVQRSVCKPIQNTADPVT